MAAKIVLEPIFEADFCPRDVIYGRYGLFKLPTTAPWKSAHALV
jgi:hypothetical protein